ncbi:unnamed protein product [Boreogadus saida]
MGLRGSDGLSLRVLMGLLCTSVTGKGFSTLRPGQSATECYCEGSRLPPRGQSAECTEGFGARRAITETSVMEASRAPPGPISTSVTGKASALRFGPIRRVLRKLHPLRPGQSARVLLEGFSAPPGPISTSVTGRLQRSARANQHECYRKASALRPGQSARVLLEGFSAPPGPISTSVTGRLQRSARDQSARGVTGRAPALRSAQILPSGTFCQTSIQPDLQCLKFCRDEALTIRCGGV